MENQPLRQSRQMDHLEQDLFQVIVASLEKEHQIGQEHVQKHLRFTGQGHKVDGTQDRQTEGVAGDELGIKLGDIDNTADPNVFLAPRKAGGGTVETPHFGLAQIPQEIP